MLYKKHPNTNTGYDLSLPLEYTQIFTPWNLQDVGNFLLRFWSMILVNMIASHDPEDLMTFDVKLLFHCILKVSVTGGYWSTLKSVSGLWSHFENMWCFIMLEINIRRWVNCGYEKGDCGVDQIVWMILQAVRFNKGPNLRLLDNNIIQL